MKKLFLAGVLAVGALNADIVPSLVMDPSNVSSPFCTPNGQNCTYTYRATLAGDTRLETGDFFTIYDFAGYVINTISQPTGWIGEAGFTGRTPTKIDGKGVVVDAANVYNLTWVYDGAGQAGPANLGSIFSADSIYRGVDLGEYAAQTRKGEFTDLPGTPTYNGGEVLVPAPGGNEPPPIPEPMSMALLGSGLTALGMLRMKSLKKK